MRRRLRLLIGIVLVLLGVFGTVAGIAIVLLVGPDGSVHLRDTRLVSDGAAITLPQLDVPELPGDRTLTLDVTVTASDQGTVFVGIGPSAAVDAYLRGVPIDVIEQVDWPGAARTEAVAGTRDVKPPESQPFWIISTGGDDAVLHWVGVPGDWTLVIMRPDGGAGLDVSAAGSITIPVLGPVGIGALLVAIAVLAAGIWITVRAAKASARADPSLPAAS